ncbi:unnamed protein product [Trichobilharzia regenti]|nr:unnamed protein product [Trichobilharzia regenti]
MKYRGDSSLHSMSYHYDFLNVLLIVYLILQISLDPSKPIIWIDAGIHAREWIAPATALSIINKVTNFNYPIVHIGYF